MTRLQIPIQSITLQNGLRVVIAPDGTAPVVTVGLYYKIGFRLEPQGRSGFAHLFEHMMFQGSENAPKMQHIKLINSSGGVLNGSTHYDVTNYFEAVPSNALERVLWLEADRGVPRRLIVIDNEAPGKPNFTAEMSDWDFAVHPADSDFVFTPPNGAKEIDFGAALSGPHAGAPQ